MFQLLYSSTSLIDRNTVGPVFALAVLLNQCLLNNPLQSVTGVLCFRDRRFGQLIEGPEGEVQSVFKRISADPRHCAIELISAGPVRSRLFPGWPMAFVGYPHDLEVIVGGGEAWRSARDSETIRSLVRVIA